MPVNKTSFCVSEWAEKLGIRANRIMDRLNRGLPIEKVLFVGTLPNLGNKRKLAEKEG